MKPLKHTFFTIWLALLPALSLCWLSCGSDAKNANGVHGPRKHYTVDLFPENTPGDEGDAVKMLTPEEAQAQSAFVLQVSPVIIIDSSFQRGSMPFYLYKVPNKGKILKAPKEYKDKYPLYFLSQKRLFEGTSLQDSAVLYLNPTKEGRILRTEINVNYQWVNGAQFLTY